MDEEMANSTSEYAGSLPVEASSLCRVSQCNVFTKTEFVKLAFANFSNDH